MTNELGEARDLAEERDHEEYLQMCATVRREFAPGYAPFKVDEMVVHLEAMRRLKAKYESACGE